MKKLLFAFALFVGFAACSNDEPVQPGTPQPTPMGTGFEVTVHDNQLSAWSVGFDICPEEKEQTYYFDVISKARWEQTDLAELQTEIDESIRGLAQMSGATYEETLEGMLHKGDRLNEYSGAGYRPETDFYIFAFYWDANGPSEEVFLYPFRTPAAGTSTETMSIQFSKMTPYSMTVTCDPSLGVVDYYLYFEEKSKADALFAQFEDPNAWLSYQAMNFGTHYYNLQEVEKKALKPSTTYKAVVMAIDEQGNRFSVEKEQTTLAEETIDRVESPLFESLLGAWSATQNTYDAYSQQTTTQNFTVTIVQQVESLDYDFRARNLLVALVDGWAPGLPYYGVEELRAEYATVETDRVPEECFGPKWLISVAEGDVMTIDARLKHSVLGWLAWGEAYMSSAKFDPTAYVPEQLFTQDLQMNLSEDGTRLTISSPLAGYYPSLSYSFMDAWQTQVWGVSDIVLTRK